MLAHQVLTFWTVLCNTLPLTDMQQPATVLAIAGLAVAALPNHNTIASSTLPQQRQMPDAECTNDRSTISGDSSSMHHSTKLAAAAAAVAAQSRSLVTQ
jgi:hypothetical protein